MNTEGLSEVAVKDAHPVVEQIAETPPELEPAPPVAVAEAPVPAPAPVAVVTNLVPYVTALSGLLVMMHKARASATVQARNTLVVVVAVGYSLYAIYACGEAPVFGAMLVLALGYLLYGFLAKRFVGEPADSPEA